MRFLFVNLNWPDLVSQKTFKVHLSFPPLDLVLLANFARERNHEFKIFDGFVESPVALSSHIKAADWIVVATTPYHMWQCPNSEWNWIVDALRAFPMERTVLSGLHSSVFPELTLRETGAHAVIRREPEVVFRDFLECGRWTDCSGVSYLSGSEFRENPSSRLSQMDELVVKDYCVDVSKYNYLLMGRGTGIFEASRGCPWKCSFCDQEMYSWKYRTKSVDVFAEEVNNALRQTGMQRAYFYDLEFTVEKERTLRMCEEFLRLGMPERLRWCCQTRADMVDEEVLEAMKAAGCCLIHFGVESANPAVLKATNKRTTTVKIEQGVSLAKKKGFETACFFMFGLPGERPEEFENTLEFARALNPTYGSFHFAIPFPGTPLYKQYLEKKGEKWGVWPATYFDEWDHERISAYVRRAYLRFYVLPRKFELRQFAYRLRNLPFKLRYFRSLMG